MAISIVNITTSLPDIAWHACVQSGSEIVTIGGQRYDGDPVHWCRSECYRIDAVTGVETASPYWLPFRVAHTAAVKVGDHNVVMGGMGTKYGDFRSLAETQVLNTANGTVDWTPMHPNGAHDPDLIKLSDERVFFCGGHAGKRPSTHAGFIDLVDGEARFRSTSLLDGRVYSRMVEHDGKVYVVGGMHYQKAPADPEYSWNLDSVEVVDIEDGTAAYLPARLDVPRRYHSIQSIGSDIYVVGGTLNEGWGSGDAHAAVERINLLTGDITRLPDLAVPRYHCQTAVVEMSGNRYVALMGGQTDDATAATAVELYDVDAGTSEIVGHTREFVDHDRITWCDGSTVSILGGSKIAGGADNYITRVDFGAGATCYRS